MFFAFPIAFEEIRGFGGGLTGLTFTSIMVRWTQPRLISHKTHESLQIGIFLASFVMPKQEKLYAKATRYGHYPEARLFPMMAGALYVQPPPQRPTETVN